MAGLVTVFGGSGFIGSQVVGALAKAGWRIRVAVRRPHRATRVYPMADVGQIHSVRADVTDPRQVEAALEGADACVNLVGILFETAGRKFAAAHVDGAANVARACAARGNARLAHVSALGADAEGEAAYARTKGEAEAAVRAALPTATILRPSIVFGPGDGFFNRFAAMAGWSPVMPLVGGGVTRFQPVYVGDVADAVSAALLDRAAAGATFELAGPQSYSFRELVEMIMRESHRQRPLLPLPFWAARPLAVAGDVMGFFGLAPIVTSDQLRLLKTDNVPSGRHPGLAELGVQATAVEAIVPGYLWRYRRGGQFAEPVPA